MGKLGPLAGGRYDTPTIRPDGSPSHLLSPSLDLGRAVRHMRSNAIRGQSSIWQSREFQTRTSTSCAPSALFTVNCQTSS